MLAICVCLWTSCSDGGSEDPANPTPKPEEVVTPEITISSDILTNGLTFNTTQGEKSVSFSTNVDWTLSIASTTGGSTWCKASATSGSKGSANVKFTVDEHTDYDDRSVSVTIKAGTASKTFTITQKCADALLITTDKYEVAQDGATIEVEVKANIDYQVAISETAKSWISEVQSKSRALTTHKHSFTIAASEDTEKREGEITFKSGDKVETVKVYQAGGPIVLLTKNEYTVSDQGETISVDLKSNVEFSVKMPEVDWITEENASRAMSSHTLKYVISPNEDYDSRSAEIVFYDKNSNATDTLKVIQAQKDAIVISQKNYEVKAAGETIEVKLSTNVEYEVTMPEADWISQVSSRALTEHTLYFKVNESTSEDDRSAEIVFKDKNSDLSEKVTITQKGIIVLSLTQDEYTISDAGETISVELKSNVEYGIQMPEVDWIKQETNSRASSTETLKFIVSANETYDSRSAEIVFYDKNSSVTDTLKISQAQKDAIVISQKNYEVDAEGETIEVKLSTNVEFEVVMPEADWVSQVTSRALTEHTLYFNVNENTSEDDRSAAIVFKNKNSELSDTIQIHQESPIQAGYVDGVVTIKTAGTMKSLLGSDYLNITSLKIVGPINGDDVSCLRGMLGSKGKLTTLDLSEASIVEGGGKYFYHGDSDLRTSNNEIGVYMFSGCKNLTSIILPNNVTSIKTYAFSGCTSLTSITTPKSVTLYAYRAFEDCKNIKKVYIEDLTAWLNSTFGEEGNPLHNGSRLYLNDKEVTELVIPENITSIKAYAFHGCISLESLKINENVTSIGSIAFYGCKALESIDIPNGVTSIGGSAFEECISLVSIETPNSVTSIGNGAFADCISLESAIINSGAIGERVFKECTSLKTLTIGNGVTKIGKDCLPSDNTIINIKDIAAWCNTELPYQLYNQVLFNGQEIIDLVIPEGVTSIKDYTLNFAYKKGYTGYDLPIKSVTIPGSVTEIEKYAINSSSIHIKDLAAWCKIKLENKILDNTKLYLNDKEITDLIIPDNITSINRYTFQGCPSLTSVTIPESVKEISIESFQNCI